MQQAINRRLEALEVANRERGTHLDRNWLRNELPQAVAVPETSVDDAKPQDASPKGWWRFLGIGGGGAGQAAAGDGARTDGAIEHGESTGVREYVDGRLESPDAGGSSSFVGESNGESGDWASKSGGAKDFR